MAIKILHICTGNSLDFQGGITNYVRCLAKSQNDKGYEVFVLADDGVDNGYKVIKFNSKIWKWSIDKSIDKKNSLQLKVILEANHFDIIHIHMMMNMNYNVVEILKKYKYIVSLHDYSYICPRVQMVPVHGIRCEKCSNNCKTCFSILEKNKFILKSLKKILGLKAINSFPIKAKKTVTTYLSKNKELLENAVMLLPVSNRVKEIYINSNIVNNYKVVHIGNNSALNFNSNFSKYKKDKINLVILSAFNEIKGSKLIIEIINKISNNNLCFHFWGHSTTQQQQLMKKNKIINHGAYNQSQLVSILDSMDMGIVVPIWEDNGPQVVMEMLNNHLPVFATNLGGIPDFVNENNGFLFNPFIKSEIDDAINFLNELNYEKVNNLTLNIKRTTTPEEHCQEILQIYNKFYLSVK